MVFPFPFIPYWFSLVINYISRRKSSRRDFNYWKSQKSNEIIIKLKRLRSSNEISDWIKTSIIRENRTIINGLNNFLIDMYVFFYIMIKLNFLQGF